MFPSPVSNNNGPKRKSAFAKLGGGGGGGKKKIFGKLKKAASKAVPDLDKAIEKKKTSKNSSEAEACSSRLNARRRSKAPRRSGSSSISIRDNNIASPRLSCP